MPGETNSAGNTEVTNAESLSFTTLINSVETHAKAYESALLELEESSSGSADSSMDITKATVATTNVQVQQSLMEMATGIAKNATDTVRQLGKKIGGG
jgi:hypothetical protein